MRRSWLAAVVALCVVATARGDELTPWQARAVEYGAGVGVAAVTVPLSMELGALIGRSSPDLVAALVPSLLVVLIVPPAAVAGAEWNVGSGLLGRRVKFHPAVWAGVAVQAVAVLLGAVGGVWVDDKLSFSLFVVADSLVMTAAITAVMTRRF